MDRLAHDIIDAAVEECEGCLQGWLIADCDHRCLGPVADCPRQFQGRLALPEQECFNRRDVGIGRRIDPFPELAWVETRRGNTLAPK